MCRQLGGILRVTRREMYTVIAGGFTAAWWTTESSDVDCLSTRLRTRSMPNTRPIAFHRSKPINSCRSSKKKKETQRPISHTLGPCRSNVRIHAQRLGGSTRFHDIYGPAPGFRSIIPSRPIVTKVGPAHFRLFWSPSRNDLVGGYHTTRPYASPQIIDNLCS